MDIGFYSYLTAALTYLLLSVLLFTGWRGGAQGKSLIFATLVTAVWAGIIGLESRFVFISPAIVRTLEVIHSFVWLIFLSQVLKVSVDPTESKLSLFFTYQTHVIYGLFCCSLFFVWGFPFILPPLSLIDLPDPQIFTQLLAAVLGLVIIEQLYRNTRPEQRWHIKFLCFALGCTFTYDFYLFSDTLLFKRVSSEIWAARGIVVALLTPLIAIASIRNPSWSVDIAVSRGIVFHSATLLVTGCYLLVMAVAGYYIKIYGGQWGTVVQIIFVTFGFLFLVLLLFSGQARAKLRVFLNKHFFNYSYDYRNEWLRMISRLSDVSDNVPLVERVILTISDLVESPSGLLWIAGENGDYELRGSYGNPDIHIDHVFNHDPIVEYMKNQQWVLNLNEIETLPELYSGLQKPGWLQGHKNAWLLVPLFHGDILLGIVLLTQPRTPIDWNWEVIDLLKTAGRQAASYLALEEAAKQLAEARQFEGFNRLSAFVIHDLKNLIAQLSLVVCNAEKHANNLEFMNDTVKTVDHAVGKMNRLMSQLRNAGSGGSKKEINLDQLLIEVTNSRSNQQPNPIYTRNTKKITVKADHDRLSSTFEHILQNAQEATGKNGEVSVTLQTRENSAIVLIKDNGCGMDEEFIRNRLFKPFDTTKGLTGMGIGAYESREYLLSLGGDLNVQSQPASGTLFKCIIPLLSPQSLA